MVESLMSDRKSVVFTHSSWILGGESDGLEGTNWSSCNNTWVITGTGTHNAPPQLLGHGR